MKIALFSDIHHRTDLFTSALEFVVKRNTEALILAGDLVQVKTLQLAKESNLPIYWVFGNNDSKLKSFANEFNIHTEPYYFNIDGIKFKLSHHPFYMSSDVDVIVFGHTHIQEVKKINSVLYLNPGEICAREKHKSECMELEILQNKFIVRAFWRQLESSKWEEETVEFER